MKDEQAKMAGSHQFYCLLHASRLATREVNHACGPWPTLCHDSRRTMIDLPTVSVAELRGHNDGPIHIIRFTGECVVRGEKEHRATEPHVTHLVMLLSSYCNCIS
jgi:hypothetical protein